ncbi:MAG: hypothetical protein B0W54_17485 [Cellvibrio sp. 79]|nr:MAG: hypothetical protein B0W54_17485 [Cellvibrio sp. 79]
MVADAAIFFLLEQWQEEKLIISNFSKQFFCYASFLLLGCTVPEPQKNANVRDYAEPAKDYPV